MKYKKKLIEVALPLEAINIASAREKSIRHGHPSTLHLWWARRPSAAARAVIFSQMVDDPSEHPEIFPTVDEQNNERNRLFKLIEELVKWDNSQNTQLLQQANDEITKSWNLTCKENIGFVDSEELFNPKKLPAFHDPFAGGGTLPLEAQRLGLVSYASDLNPVAVLINKSMIEIPPKFSGKPPVNPISNDQKNRMDISWHGASGIAEDVRYYGSWIKSEAEKRIGNFYTQIEVTNEMSKNNPDLQNIVGEKLTVIAWLWARTVKSPDPAFSNIDVPLVSTFLISTKAGREVYVDPQIVGNKYDFKVKTGKPQNIDFYKNGTKIGRGGNFKCLLSGTPIPVSYIREQGLSGELSSKLMAIVVESSIGRIFLSPDELSETLASTAIPAWYPDEEINFNPRDIRTQLYGLTRYCDLFTSRQLLALTTFSDLVNEVREKIIEDAIKCGISSDNVKLKDSGLGALAYAEAVSIYLAFAVDRCSDYWSTLAVWAGDFIAHTFGRQAIPMTWDFAECNPFSDSTGCWSGAVDWVCRVVDKFPANTESFAFQFDAAKQNISKGKVVSTDPPYYDNIGYADLADYFYVWMRGTLKSVYPDIFSTLVVPKADELVATPYRHGSKENAEIFFLEGMTHAMHNISKDAHPAFPVTIYYAFKQTESNDSEGTTNTGWDTFLAAVIESGFSITGTWPMRTERTGRMVSNGTNALASSIILVCRKVSKLARVGTRREFVATLKEELPSALKLLQAGNIAPVDLAQAAIGPGMSVYTRFSKVIDAEGNAISVRAALSLINQTLDEALAEQEGDFDGDSRWALTWFDSNGFDEGEYGLAEQLSISRNTSVDGLVAGGIITSKSGKVRLLKPLELKSDWSPSKDKRLTAWEIVHQLIKTLESHGESAVAKLILNLGSNAEVARELCYRLYTLCERKKRTIEALSYNGLVQSWPEIIRLSRESSPASKSSTQDLFDQE